MKLFAVVAATSLMVASASADNYYYTTPFAPVPKVKNDKCFLTQSEFKPAASPVDIHFKLDAKCSAPIYYKCKSDSVPKNAASVAVVENAITVTIDPKHRPRYTLPGIKPVERPTTKPPTKAPHKYGYADEEEDEYDSYDSYDEEDNYYKRPTRPAKPSKLDCSLESFRLLAISQHTVYGDNHPLEVELHHTCNNGTAKAIVNQLYNVKNYGPDPKPTYKKKPTKKYYGKKPTKKSSYGKKDDSYVEKYLALNQETYVAPKTQDPYKKKSKYDSDDEYYSDDDDYYYEDKEIYYKKDADISVDEWSKEATIILKKIINTVAAKLVNVSSEGTGYYKTYSPQLHTGPVPLPFKFKAKFLSYFGNGAYAYNGTTTWTTKPNQLATVFVTGHALETDEKVPAFCELVHSLDVKRPYEYYNNRKVVPLGPTRPVWKFCGNNCTQEWDNVTCPTAPTKPTYKPKKYSYKKDDYKKDDYKKDDKKY